MRTITLLSLLFLAGPALAMTPAEESEKLREVSAEVRARRTVREHESGIKKVTESELAAARLVIAKAAEKKARAVASGPDGGFLISFKDVSLEVVAQIWRGVFGFDVAISERLKEKKVTFTISDPSLEQFRSKFSDALERNSVYRVWRSDGSSMLDSVPAKLPPK